jgi:hypothetical protein
LICGVLVASLLNFLPVNSTNIIRLYLEFVLGYPIFPGENEQEQLSMIMEVIDLPPSHVLEQGTRRKLFFGRLKFYVRLDKIDFYAIFRFKRNSANSIDKNIEKTSTS